MKLYKINGATIYVLGFKELPGIIKVGITRRSGARRVSEIGRQLRATPMVEYSTYVEEADQFEAIVHRQFKFLGRHVQGEYFEASPQLAIDFIELYRDKGSDLEYWAGKTGDLPRLEHRA